MARCHSITRVVVGLTLLARAHLAHGEPKSVHTGSERERAAAAYDGGVSAFDRGDYADSVRSFLAADAAVPNADAVANAIAAARRARDPALLREAGMRGLERESSAPQLGALARAALAEAEALSAKPAPQAAATPVRTPTPEGGPAGKPAPSAQPAANGSERHAPKEQAEATTRTWPSSVFFVGVGTTFVLTAITTWSGIDTLNAYARLPGTKHENDAVMARAHRTDALLAATLVVAGATTYVGLRLVDWNRGPALTANLSSGGATLALRGVF